MGRDSTGITYPGKQSLDMYCRVKEVDISFIEKLIMSICSEMEILEWNLIQTNCLMLDPELIFITNSNQEIIFTVYPGGSGTIGTEFQQLMEFLLTKVDHKDTRAVKQHMEFMRRRFWMVILLQISGMKL